jgi:uncharacterized integral membrane protein (TIGR00698 family)
MPRHEVRFVARAGGAQKGCMRSPTSALGARSGSALIPLGALLAALPFVSSGAALLAGVLLALLVGNPYAATTRRLAHGLITVAVVGLGAATDLAVVARVGSQGVLVTAGTIAACLAAAWALAKVLAVPRDTALLVGVGTAICGGSAIAAVAPVLRAKESEVSIALATVFLLNALALFVFPAVGHAVGLDPARFGTWAALAIHDTSSVVGAAVSYGGGADVVATTTKLARALWIVPIVAVVSAARRRGAAGEQGKAPRPWFIAGFVIASALFTWVPALRPAGAVLAIVARRAMVVALFFVGAGLTRTALRSVGARPFVLGLLLWIFMGSGTLALLLATRAA